MLRWMFFALDEQQRHAVDEADNIRAPAIERTFDPQLPNAEEVIVVGIVEVEDAERARFHAAFRRTEADLHAAAQQIILLAIGLKRRLRRIDLGYIADRIPIGFGG